MVFCRIYLCTYRRNHLLPRAFDSLLNQTFTDWVCEVHNDDPQDPFPRQLVEKTADPRIAIVDHSENLGSNRTFNQIFQNVSESFVSLLEDDNWWQPDFLEKMIEAMEKFPEVQVAWANMRFWQEEVDGTWTDTKKNIWERSETDNPELFWFPNKQQIGGALHSNGAMLVRTQYISNYAVPDRTPFEAAEAVRDRTFHYPILFLPQVLANFAITRETSRSKNRGTWGQIQSLLIASFFKYVPMEEDTLRGVWYQARSQVPRSTATLFFAASICRECRKIVKYATLEDWIFFIASCLKRPSISWRVFKSISSHRELWDFLNQHTALRVREAQQQGFKSI